MIKRTIVERTQKATKTQLHSSNLLQRIYSNRSVTTADELDYGLDKLLPYDSLLGIEKASELLFEALSNNDEILIVGDFDADGATSTTLAVLVLRAVGVKKINYLVPNRFEYGYGLSPELVADAVVKFPSARLIVTVDNGISSVEGVALAQQHGLKVLVTDHHLAGDVLPSADAIVNPNQPNDEFPSKHLAGVGVMFYVLLALRKHLREQGWFEQQSIAIPNLAHYLDIVALGTVADVVVLDANNRRLVDYGIRLINAGRCRLGIKALLKLSKKNIGQIRSTDLGFSVGPRLNAAGRLDDMGLGIECLLAEDEQQAIEQAELLHSLNLERQTVEKEMQDEALQKLNLDDVKLDDSSLTLTTCLYEAHWHQGIVGLLASRIKERTQKPCIVFADEDDANVKGSARSVKGVHIRDALALVNARHPEIISKFGGHAMAAGLSLKKVHLEAFKQAFEEAVTEILAGKPLDNSIETDGNLTSEELTLHSTELLAQAGPFGQGFEEPSFHGEFTVLNQRLLNGQHLKLTLRLQDSDQAIQAIAFRVDADEWMEPCKKIKAVYQLDINRYFNQPELQLIISYIERLE